MNKKSFFGQTLVGPVCVLFSFAVTLFLASDGLAQTQGTGFKQAVAEAALSERALADYYRDTGYVPVWVDPVAGQARRQALFEAMARAPMHGLPPSRYDAGALYEELQAAQTSRDLGYAEVAMSRMFIKLARDMQTGLLQPRDAHSSIKRDVVPSTPAALLSGFAEAEPRVFLRSLTPQTAEYRQLMRQKIQLEETVARGGWGPSGPGKALKPGATGAAVVRLRDRLMAMGYLHRTATASYDTAMESAVRRFQSTHGLEADGVAGASTLAEINITAAERLKSVLVAMERERWLNTPEGRGSRHILVNLTDFSARVFDDGVESFFTRAVVGKNSNGRRSPEFSDEMEFMVINPTWHVPRSIAVKEYLPKLRRNRYAVGHLKMVNSRGQVVSRDRINFSAYGARSFPYAMKQPPSDKNALGLVKFMFPNQYNIYLHDTPHKDLFSRETRAFSHGCIRLADPFGFAYHLLTPQQDDPKAFFHNALETKRETKVLLDRKVPVHIVYRTAFTDAKGSLQFRRDVYGRDAEIWNALVRTGVTLPGVQG